MGQDSVEARTLSRDAEHEHGCLLHGRLDGAPRAPRAASWRCRRRSHAPHAGHAPGGLRRLLRPHGRPRRALRAAEPAPRRSWTLIAFGPRAHAERATRARARDAPPGPRRPRRAGGPLRGRDAVRPPTTRRCCSGSWPASPTPRCWPTSATSPACRDGERDGYWQDYRVIGGLFGLARRRDARRLPRAFASTWTAWSRATTLHVTPEARELAVQIVMRPPVPLQVRPLLELFQLRDGRPAAGARCAAQLGLLVGPGA